ASPASLLAAPQSLRLVPRSLPLSVERYGHHRHLPSFPTRRSSDLREGRGGGRLALLRRPRQHLLPARLGQPLSLHARRRPALPRSEEHTSELQSRENLVCRLLLEKKKKKETAAPYPRAHGRTLSSS